VGIVGLSQPGAARSRALALNGVGVVCALASEARHLGPISQQEPIQSLPDGTLVAVTGMGPRAASAGAAALIEAGCTALASFGLAGGLDPDLEAGAVLLPAEVIGTDSQRVVTHEEWRRRVAVAVATHAPVRSGSLITTPHAIASVADKADLFRTTGAAAVDMESLAVGEVASRHGLPFIAVRVIVDSAGDVLPRAVTAAADKQGRLQIWRLIGALTLAPRELAPLIRLARRYRAANRSLAAIARTGSLAPVSSPRLS
jgi:adenosylhomocysteine nucleosidase